MTALASSSKASILQLLIDVLAVVFGVLFLMNTAVTIVAAVLILLFVAL